MKANPKRTREKKIFFERMSCIVAFGIYSILSVGCAYQKLVLIEILAFTDATRHRRAQTLLKKSFCDCGPVTLLREQVLGSDGLFGRDSFAGSRESFVSRSTSLLTMANRKLADNPHIRTPMMLSSGPKVRHICGRTMSP